jgi:DNA-binding NtrC family response regulator
LATPRKQYRVLFVDDEATLQEFMRMELPRLGHEVTVCPDGTSALRAIEKTTFDVAILDLRMPDMTGFQVLEYLKKVSPETEAVMMSAYDEAANIVQAINLGAADYLVKPCGIPQLQGALAKVMEKKKLRQQNTALKTRVQAAEGAGMVLGRSPAMASVHNLVETVAPTDATILIQGETGTGKDVVARAIHAMSRRRDMPFVPVNCGAISPTLVESELFGHVRGAFTGADKDHKGLFEVADGGTLFLDELGELDKNIQVKLLRFLESGELRRLGETRAIKLDVRVVCATNRDLDKMIAKDEFREDLKFRLNTFEVHLPPLRDRREDLPDLARYLLSRSAKRPLDQVAGLLSPEAIQTMLEYDWPGNVRELANSMEYAYILAGGGAIAAQHLPSSVRNRKPRLAVTGSPAAVAPQPIAPQATPAGPPKTLHDVEMEHIFRVMAKHNGNKNLASQELGISLKTLYNKLNRWDEEHGQRAG